MRKLLEWLGIGHKMTVIMSWNVGEVNMTIEASGATVETVRKLLAVANAAAKENEKVVTGA